MSGEPRVVDVQTPHGPARVHLHAPEGERAARPRGALMLGHGAGGSVTAPDLQAATATAAGLGIAVALVEQPYRVAGRRSAAPAKQLDAAWLAVAGHLRGSDLAGLPLVTGGRSSGARVACRTAAETGAAGVLCLAFPLEAPNGSRLGELEAVEVPVLVVQGMTDRFGMPPAGPGRQVAQVKGDHALRSDRAAVAAAVGTWLDELLP